MRDIKARAWFRHISGEEIIQFAGMYKGFNGVVGPWLDFVRPEEWEQLTEWQQFTGLHDKNGVEVYEGHIVEWKNAYGMKDGNAVVVWDIPHGAWYVENYAGGDTWCTIYNVIDNLFVIGDIHENPELLDGR